MKVIHYISSIDKSSGGTTAYMQLLSSELKDKINFIVAAGISPNPVFLEGVKVEFFNTNLIRWFRIQKEFKKFLKHEQPDLVHINGIWNPDTYLFQKVSFLLGIKTILSPHGMLAPYILKRNFLKKKIALALYQDKAIRLANFFHVTADSELNDIRRLGYSQDTEVIPNGIDLSTVKQRFNWNTNTSFKILFLSRLHSQKGVELLIEAISYLKTANIKIDIAGTCDFFYIEKLNNLVKEKKVEHMVEFLGGVYGNEKWKLINQADLFILPSFSECFGIVVPEALATGIPVITTTGTPWEELNTEKCGWWIDLSVDNLVTTIREAINRSPAELKEMGERGRQLVENKYDIKAVAVKMFDFYNSIIDG